MLIIASKTTILTLVGIIACALCIIAISAASVSYYAAGNKQEKPKDIEVKEEKTEAA